MHTSDSLLDATIPIAVLEPFRRVNGALLALVKTFTADDWRRPTVHPNRDVKDLTAHLLHGTLRRLSFQRDAYNRPGPPPLTAHELIAWIQQDNREFMAGMRGLSPRVLIELLELNDPQLLAMFEGADPMADALGVVWAGEWQSRAWFDIAREYTEKWHHQQQLRDATGRPPLCERALLEPVLETFVRGLPFAYRHYDAAPGTRISVSIAGETSQAWTLVRMQGGFALFCGADSKAEAALSVPADVAWRLWTKGLSREDAMASISCTGASSAIDPLLSFVAIMA